MVVSFAVRACKNVRMSRRPSCIRFDLLEVEAKLEYMYLFIHFISHKWDSRWSRKEMPPV
jgi:hypothetical protein